MIVADAVRGRTSRQSNVPAALLAITASSMPSQAVVGAASPGLAASTVRPLARSNASTPMPRRSRTGTTTVRRQRSVPGRRRAFVELARPAGSPDHGSTAMHFDGAGLSAAKRQHPVVVDRDVSGKWQPITHPPDDPSGRSIERHERRVPTRHDQELAGSPHPIVRGSPRAVKRQRTSPDTRSTAVMRRSPSASTSRLRKPRRPHHGARGASARARSHLRREPNSTGLELVQHDRAVGLQPCRARTE